MSGFYPIVKTFANYTTVDEIILNPGNIVQLLIRQDGNFTCFVSFVRKISKIDNTMLGWSRSFELNIIQVRQINGEEQKNRICLQ
jgi:hypothetical protein